MSRTSVRLKVRSSVCPSRLFLTSSFLTLFPFDAAATADGDVKPEEQRQTLTTVIVHTPPPPSIPPPSIPPTPLLPNNQVPQCAKCHSNNLQGFSFSFSSPLLFMYDLHVPARTDLSLWRSSERAGRPLDGERQPIAHHTDVGVRERREGLSLLRQHCRCVSKWNLDPEQNGTAAPPKLPETEDSLRRFHNPDSP